MKKNSPHRITPMKHINGIPSPQNPYKGNSRTNSSGARAKSSAGASRLFQAIPMDGNNYSLPQISLSRGSTKSPPSELVDGAASFTISRNVSSDRLLSKDTSFINRSENEYDKFFLELNEIPLHTAIEKFFTEKLRAARCVYWQEISSIQTLYSQTLGIQTANNKSLVGYTFFLRSLLKVTHAGDHSAYDHAIDGQIANPVSSVVLFPLTDADNLLTGIVEVVRRYDADELSSKEEQFISLFQRKYKSYSKCASNVNVTDEDIIELMQLMELEQYMLLFRKKMLFFFNCRVCEIWTYNKKAGTMKRYAKEITEIRPNKCGIIYEAFSREQMFNCINSKMQSSYKAEVDGEEEEAILATPMTDQYSGTIYAVILRGNKKNNIFTTTDEKMFQKLAPYIVTSFKNAFKFSDAGNNNEEKMSFIGSVVDVLPAPHHGQTVNEIIDNMMNALKKVTRADRAAFYIVDYQSKTLNSLFHDGLNDPIITQIGRGHAGMVVESGQTINTVDAYEDTIFDASTDLETGYRTKQMLTTPIVSPEGNIVAVVQVLNKLDKTPFSTSDELATKAFGTLCSCMTDSSTLSSKFQDLLSHTNGFKQVIETNDIDLILEAICSTLDIEILNLFTIDEASQTLILSKNKGKPNITTPKNLQFDVFIGYKVLYSDNVLSDIKMMKYEQFDSRVLNLCISPMKEVGILELINKRGKFTQNDLDYLSMFVRVIEFILERDKLNKIIENGKLTAEINKKFTQSEIGHYTVPLSFIMTEEEGSSVIKIDYPLESIEDIKIIYSAFDILGLLKYFKITNDKLFRFVSRLKKSYKDVVFHNWTLAVNTLQYMLYQIANARLTAILGPIEFLSLIVSCLSCYVGNDGTNSSYNVKMETAIGMLYNNKVMESNSCSILIDILHHDKTNILTKVHEDEKSICWKLLVNFLLNTDPSAGLQFTQKVKDILSNSMMDLNNDEHRMLLLILLFKAATLSYVSRPYDISDKLINLQIEEMHLLGDKEAGNKLPYSTEMHCRDIFNKSVYAKEFMENYAIPIFETLSSILADLKPAYVNVKNNLANWTKPK